MDALGLGGYDSSSESEDEPEAPPAPVSDGMPSSNFSVQKRNPTSSNDPPSVPPVPPPPIRVNALDGYASSAESESEEPETTSVPPSEKALNLFPPAPPPIPLVSPPAPDAAKPVEPTPPSVKSPKRKRTIVFPPSPKSKPDPNLQKKVKSWTNDIRNGVTPNLADFIQNTKGFLNPYLLTRTCKEFRIDEYSTNFTNFKQNLADAQRHKNSYLALRDRQNAQIEQHQKRKQKREESRAAKRQKVSGTSRFLPRALSNTNSLAGLNVSSQFLRQMSQSSLGLGR